MAAEEEASIPFGVSHEQQSFRLLELPPTLLEQVTSKHPPILYLKSAFSDSSASTTTPNAILCTHDQTFQLRQVQSSNTIYVLQPSAEIPSLEDDHVKEPGVSVIGQCKGILEVVPSAGSTIPYLKHRLPLFHAPHVDTTSGLKTESFHSNDKQTLLSDAPCSAHELEEAWIKLCAFEMSYQTWRPSAVTLLGIWKAFLSAATVKGVNIMKDFSISDVSVLVEEEEFPRVLLQAMLRRLISGQERGFNGSRAIDQHECVPWVGDVLLEAQHQYTGIAIPDFVREWQDLLPEVWRELVDVEMLKEKVVLGNMIAYQNFTEETRDLGDHLPIPSASKVPNKWHEKFKNAQ